MTSAADSLSREPRRTVLAVLLGALILTLVFAAQDAMREAIMAGAVNWPRALLVNALDWFGWSLLVPIIVVVGRNHRLDDRVHSGTRATIWIVLGVLCALTHSAGTGLLVHWWRLVPPPGGAPALPPLARFLTMWITATAGFNLIIFAMISGVFHATMYYRDLRVRRIGEADLRARLARAELHVLQMQLQPHFLFNALHTVSSLMEYDTPTARRVITSLGDLLRSSLDHTARQETSLRSELAFVDRYLDIQKARFQHRLEVETDIAPGALDALVPSLVLQPLVENAIRHGIEPFAGGGRVRIQATRDNERLILAVRDDGPVRGNAAIGATPGRTTSGIGLANIEARLAQLYGPAQQFHAARQSNGDFAVVISLPFHTERGTQGVDGDESW